MQMICILFCMLVVLQKWLNKYHRIVNLKILHLLLLIKILGLVKIAELSFQI